MSALGERQIMQTCEDLAYILQFLAVSLLVDDDRIFVEFLGWLRGVLTSRQLPASTTGATLPTLTRSLVAADRLTDRIGRRMHAAAASAPQMRREGIG